MVLFGYLYYYDRFLFPSLSPVVTRNRRQMAMFGYVYYY